MPLTSCDLFHTHGSAATDCQQSPDQRSQDTSQRHTATPLHQVLCVDVTSFQVPLCCGEQSITFVATVKDQLLVFGFAGMQEKPLFRFGLISDIQYADIKDGHSFHGTPRYYRASLDGLRRAVTAWQQQHVEFAVQCGDIIDGFNPKDQSEAAMQSVLSEFAKLQKPVYHMIGNHCLYNLPRHRLNELLSIKSKASYYSFSPHKAWRFVVIDGYDVSMLGWPDSHPLHAEAKAILDEKNVNEASTCHLLSRAYTSLAALIRSPFLVLLLLSSHACASHCLQCSSKCMLPANAHAPAMANHTALLPLLHSSCMMLCALVAILPQNL